MICPCFDKFLSYKEPDKFYMRETDSNGHCLAVVKYSVIAQILLGFYRQSADRKSTGFYQISSSNLPTLLDITNLCEICYLFNIRNL